jgi:hypothetical protein
MGVTLTYQAIPPQSSFYKRLQNDRAFRVLANSLFCSGNLFNLFNHDPEEFNEYMGEAISSHPDVLCGTELETSMLIGDFREAVIITCRDYPKIVSANGSLEKSFAEVRDRLIEELSTRKFEDADDIVATLLYGDIDLGKRVLPEEESYGFALTSREAVKKGANILRQIEPETLFPGEEGWWYSMNFREWKKFYILADDLGAEIIMDVL